MAYGAEAVAEIHSSGVALRMLDDICASTVGTLDLAVEAGWIDSREVLAEYPSVLSECDCLTFNEPAEALAYLALHLPDRYCRVVQVLEALLLWGALPLGRTTPFAVVDIGAGPGPGVFAVRSFYAALSHLASERHPGWPVSTLGVASVVERSQGMSWVMQHFAEQLNLFEQGRDPRQPLAASISATPNPCVAQLDASVLPFGAHYADFAQLDLRREHHWARRQVAEQLEDELDVGSQSALRLAYQKPIGVPSSYALALMTNFLTTPDSVPKFADAIRHLMRGTLVPGGVVLVLGQPTFVTKRSMRSWTRSRLKPACRCWRGSTSRCRLVADPTNWPRWRH